MTRKNKDAIILEEYHKGNSLKQQYKTADWITKAYILKNMKRLKAMLEQFDNFK